MPTIPLLYPIIQRSCNNRGLRVVAHFGGVPHQANTCHPLDATFCFPELMLQVKEGMSVPQQSNAAENISALHWQSFLCAHKKQTTQLPVIDEESRPLNSGSNLPSSLHEQYHVFTQLQPKEFGACLCLGIINFMGVSYLKRSLQVGGLLHVSSHAPSVVLHVLVSIMLFYSKYFLLLPLARLPVTLVLNVLVRRRNDLRSQIAEHLSKRSDKAQLLML